MDDDDASLARTDSMSQSQRGPRHRRMESVETRSSMDLPPDALLQVDVVQPGQSWRTKKTTRFVYISTNHKGYGEEERAKAQNS